jgi:hypothetical protein
VLPHERLKNRTGFRFLCTRGLGFLPLILQLLFLKWRQGLRPGNLQERALRSDLHSMLAARPQPQKYRAFFGHRWVDVANDHNIIQK